MTERCRSGFRDFAIRLGSPALRLEESCELGQSGPRLLGRPEDLSPGSKRARSQSEGAWAGRLLRVRSKEEAEPSPNAEPGCRLLSSAARDATSQVRPTEACAGRAGPGLPGLPPPLSSDHIRGPSYPDEPLIVCPGPVNLDQQDPRDAGTCSGGCLSPRLRAGLDWRGASPISCLCLRGDPRGYWGRRLEKMCVKERNLA